MWIGVTKWFESDAIERDSRVTRPDTEN